MRVEPYFKTSLAKSFKGKYHQDKGASLVLNTMIEAKNLGNFLVEIPDPVTLNLNNAKNFILEAESLKQTLNKSKENTIFSKKLNNEEDLKNFNTLEEIKKFDPDVLIIRKFDDNQIFKYIQITMGIIISLITAIESFLNMIIPFDFKKEIINKEGNINILDRDQIVKKFSIEKKIDIISELKNKNNIKQEIFWESFKLTKKLRNDIIHFKKINNNLNDLWNPIIVKFFESDFNKIFEDFVKLINYIDPSYLNKNSN